MFELLILVAVAFVATVAYIMIKDHKTASSAASIVEAEVKDVVNTDVAAAKAVAPAVAAVAAAPVANTAAK